MVQWLQIGQIRKSVDAFLQDQRGSVFAIMGFGLVMAAGLAALAIDMSYLYGLKGRLQTTADFAVLAAVSQLPDEDAARTMALDYAAKNMPASEHGGVLANADAVTGNWDAGTRTFTPAGDPINAVRVVTRRSQANGNAAGLFFASVLGFNQVDVETSATASFQSGGACVVALDPSVDDALKISGNAPSCFFFHTLPQPHHYWMCAKSTDLFSNLGRTLRSSLAVPSHGDEVNGADGRRHQKHEKESH